MRIGHPNKHLAPEVIEYLRALYDGSIRFLDQGLAQLFEFLEVAPNGRPTLWIITSDHGEEFKEHGVLMHSGYLHEEMLRVPLIFSLPGTLGEDQRIDTPIQTVDLFPTLVELLDLPIPENLSGRSFAAAVRGDQPAKAAVAMSAGTKVEDLLTVEAHRSWGVIGTLETGRFKWVSGRDSGLFRLDVDPHADHNVAKRYPKEREVLIQAADELGLREALKANARRKRANRAKARYDKKVVEQLRALGYVEEAESLGQ